MADKKQLTLGFSPWGNGLSIAPFDKLFPKSKNILVDGFDGVDAVILWGGEDWHPSYYNEKRHPFNGADERGPSERDIFEYKAMLYCKMNRIPMIGVCRGAQGLCIGAGGKLIQHVTGHGSSHPVKTDDGKFLQVTSTHHQMMYPFDVKHKLLAWTDQPLSYRYEGEKGTTVSDMWKKPEPEIVYFPQLRGIAIQGHPEYDNATEGFINYCLELVDKFCLSKDFAEV